jgi:hypothetical protein
MHDSPNLSMTYSVFTCTPLINKNENNNDEQFEQDTCHNSAAEHNTSELFSLSQSA